MRQLSLVRKKRVHVAIMRKSWGLTPKLLTGEKTIESRWYRNRCRPWNQIETGDIVYFKDSGEPVRIRSVVKKVLQFDNLNSEKVKQILKKYGKADGLGIGAEDFDKYFEMFRNKRYCVIIALKNIERIEPFQIDKTGFGTMSAWLTVNDINRIRGASDV